MNTSGYICIYMPYVYNPVCTEYIRLARFVNGEESGCRFEGQRKETWIYTWPART